MLGAMSATTDDPTVVTVPCFSGAPWELEQLTPLGHRPLRTMRLPEALDSIEGYADFLAEQVADLDDYVLVGDSFGAVIALAFATRHPSGLRGLVLSGGFAANPVDSPLLRAKMAGARFLPGPLYRHLTLRLHARSLASPYDAEGQEPLSVHDTVHLFRRNTPWRSYVTRTKAAFAADYTHRLARINVPTLILTPTHDTLIGEDAAAIMRRGIADAVEHVLPRTGHMFRFTHPVTYSAHIEQFIEHRVLTVQPRVRPEADVELRPSGRGRA